MLKDNPKFMWLIEEQGLEALFSKIQPSVNPITPCCLPVLPCTGLEVSTRNGEQGLWIKPTELQVLTQTLPTSASLDNTSSSMWA